MKKEKLPYYIFVLITIPVGLILSFIPNDDTIRAMWARVGHVLIFGGIYEIGIAISHKIRHKSQPNSVKELMSQQSGIFSWYPWCFIKDHHKITIKLDTVYYIMWIITFGLLSGATTYILLPLILNFEPTSVFPTVNSVIITLIIDYIVTCYLIITFGILLPKSVSKIIDFEEKSILISNKKLKVSIPFGNLSQLEVSRDEDSIWKNYDLLLPIDGLNSDISKIKGLLSNKSLVLIRKKGKAEVLEEIKSILQSRINDAEN